MINQRNPEFIITFIGQKKSFCAMSFGFDLYDLVRHLMKRRFIEVNKTTSYFYTFVFLLLPKKRAAWFEIQATIEVK